MGGKSVINILLSSTKYRPLYKRKLSKKLVIITRVQPFNIVNEKFNLLKIMRYSGKNNLFIGCSPEPGDGNEALADICYYLSLCPLCLGEFYDDTWRSGMERGKRNLLSLFCLLSGNKLGNGSSF